MAPQKVIFFKYKFNFTILLHYIFIFFFSPNKNFSKANVTNLPAVPTAFVQILEITLQKLVAANLIDKQLSGPSFFCKMRVKFSNATKKVLYYIIFN